MRSVPLLLTAALLAFAAGLAACVFVVILAVDALG